MIKKTIARLLVAACATTAVLAIAAPASADNRGSYLRRDDGTSGSAPTTLYANDYIQRTSNGYTYWLILQSNGNLVLYKGNSWHAVSKVCWESGTYSVSTLRAVYQDDGNFVIYTIFLDVPQWGSNTVGDNGTTVDISASGKLYVGTKAISSAC
jgi:hypothetical protein